MITASSFGSSSMDSAYKTKSRLGSGLWSPANRVLTETNATPMGHTEWLMFNMAEMVDKNPSLYNSLDE